jgi:DNA polymerase-1
MSQPQKNFIILDANAIIHRAYHAIPPNFLTKQRELVNAVYGFTSMFLNVVGKIDCEYMACAFDMSGPTFRHEFYEGYKKNRKKMDDDLASQLEKIREIIRVFNVPIYEKETFEADDIIGTLAKKICALDKDIHIYIISGDRDILQLINDNVTVVLPGKTFSDMIFYDEAKFVEKFGFKSENLVDFKALSGDTSDDIPGIPKIGQKSATDLVKEFGSLESIYSHIDELRPAMALKLREGKELGDMSKKLATINRDAPIDFNLSDAEYPKFDVMEVQKKFLEFEFKSLVTRIPQANTNAEISKKLEENTQSALGLEEETQDDMQYALVKNSDDLYGVVQEMKKKKLFAIDCETDSLDYLHCNTVGISIGFSEKRAYYIHVNNEEVILGDGEKKASDKRIGGLWKECKEILEDRTYKKVGHNIKFDMHALERCAIKLHGEIFDTMIGAYILGLPEIDLKNLSLLYEGVRMRTYDDLSNHFKTHITEINREELAKYSCMDAEITYRLYERFSKMLDEVGSEKIKSLFYTVEMPLVRVLFDMENVGVKLDVSYLQNLKGEVEKQAKEIEKNIYEIVGHEFNINSPKQLSVVIFEELHLPKGRKTKTGYSTDERYFTTLGDVHPIVKPLRAYKELIKLQSTYINTLPQLVDEQGRIHTSYNQTVAATGRLSSSNPNLQNIPVRTEIGNKIREAFVADEHSLLISFDYSQIELRILAHFSQDPALIEAFTHGQDIHIKTAQLIFNKESISAKERRIAKTINFGIVYGISSFGLSGQLGISREEAQDLINKYFKTYTGVYAYIEKQKEIIMKEGVVESLLGRRRTFNNLEQMGSIAKNAIMREAINMPLQATNADIIKMAMNQASELVQKEKYPANLLLQVHDELIFEYTDIKKDYSSTNLDAVFSYDTKLADFCHKIKKIMENPVKLSVPIKAEIKLGFNWGTLEEMVES